MENSHFTTAHLAVVYLPILHISVLTLLSFTIGFVHSFTIHTNLPEI